MKHLEIAAAVLCAGLLFANGLASAQVRPASASERALDQVAFQPVERALAERLTDIQSVAVLLRGRVVYEFYRDGTPDKLRDVQSVRKSAVSLLAGVALGQGKLAGLDQPVLASMPEWAPLNRDPRAAAITLRHLLSMTAGFEFDDPAGIIGGTTRPADAWARPLRTAPGEQFAYDNALIPVLTAVVEKAAGMPIADFARKELVAPLGLAEPGYQRGLQLRTMDMAKLGQLALNDGMWDGRQLVPAAFVRAATGAQSKGGPPASIPYGYLWWVLPSAAPRATFMASGYAGQMIWVDPALELVVAATSTVSAGSQQRGQTVQLLRGGLVAAARQRATEAR